MDEDFITGNVTVVGDYITADVILPVRYYFLPPQEMADHVLEELGEDVSKKVRANSLLIAGQAFGSGTGREAPARALREAGVRAVLGGPFARIFFRNAINNGILVIDCPEITTAGILDGDTIRVDIKDCQIGWNNKSFEIKEVPKIIKDIIKAGSLIDYGRNILQRD